MGFWLLAIVGDARDNDHRRSLVALDLDLGEGPQLWSGAGPLRKGILKTANLVTSIYTKKSKCMLGIPSKRTRFQHPRFCRNWMFMKF